MSGVGVSGCGQDLKLGLVMLKSTSARSCPYFGSFLIFYVPENCKIGCSLVLHTRGHQIQFPPFVPFSLQFIPRTIAKPILLDHWFHSVLSLPRHLEWFSAGCCTESGLTSEPPPPLITKPGSPFSPCLQTNTCLVDGASLFPAPNSRLPCPK